MDSTNPYNMKPKIIMMACVIISLLVAKVAIAEPSTYKPTPKTPEQYIAYYAELNQTDESLLLKVAKCESKLNIQSKGDGGNATGIYQYWNDTFERFSKLYGEELDINSYHDQIKLTSWIFANYPQYRKQWTSFRAIQNGGVYSFYSTKLKQHFTAICK